MVIIGEFKPAILVKKHNKYTLPPLPYAYGALEPYIEAQIMELHHGKHQQAYVDGLNAALDKHPQYFEKPLIELLQHIERLPMDIQAAVRNHGGGVYNHTFFWHLMSINGGGEPVGKSAEVINDVFGSFEIFKDKFTTSAKNRFGSGWVWLSLDAGGTLVISSTANQDTPLSDGLFPILGLDVWEHAYYLQYFNRRTDYISAWWNIVNWEQVEKNYVTVMSNSLSN